MPLESIIFQQLTPWLKANRWFVGFSGGMDSTVLLHLLVTLKKQYSNLPELQAIYIHHGLQEFAEAWPAHCQKVCDELGVVLQIIPVRVAKVASVEQAARDARYGAFKQIIKEGDVLLTAQHQRDQVETVLFRLARGAGVRGLSGIPSSRSLDAGTVARPMLTCSYDSLKAYAQLHKLQWVEDPSNEDTHYARNYIRHKLIPAFQNHWPQSLTNITQAAEHLQEAQLLLNELAEQDIERLVVEPVYPWLTLPSLLFAPLTALSWERQKNVLSYWLSAYTLLPSTSHWQGLKALLNAAEDATPIWTLHNESLHRGNGRIWLLANNWLINPASPDCEILPETTVSLPNNGVVKLSGELSDTAFIVRYRQGGEVMHLISRGHRDLKRLLNEQGVPSFIRSRLPLLYDRAGHLVAVANFPELCDQAYKNTPRFTFAWQPY